MTSSGGKKQQLTLGLIYNVFIYFFQQKQKCKGSGKDNGCVAPAERTAPPEPHPLLFRLTQFQTLDPNGTLDVYLVGR